MSPPSRTGPSTIIPEADPENFSEGWKADVTLRSATDPSFHNVFKGLHGTGSNVTHGTSN